MTYEVDPDNEAYVAVARALQAEWDDIFECMDSGRVYAGALAPTPVDLPIAALMLRTRNNPDD